MISLIQKIEQNCFCYQKQLSRAKSEEQISFQNNKPSIKIMDFAKIKEKILKKNSQSTFNFTSGGKIKLERQSRNHNAQMFKRLSFNKIDSFSSSNIKMFSQVTQSKIMPNDKQNSGIARKKLKLTCLKQNQSQLKAQIKKLNKTTLRLEHKSKDTLIKQQNKNQNQMNQTTNLNDLDVSNFISTDISKSPSFGAHMSIQIKKNDNKGSFNTTNQISFNTTKSRSFNTTNSKELNQQTKIYQSEIIPVNKIYMSDQRKENTSKINCYQYFIGDNQNNIEFSNNQDYQTRNYLLINQLSRQILQLKQQIQKQKHDQLELNDMLSFQKTSFQKQYSQILTKKSQLNHYSHYLLINIQAIRNLKYKTLQL